MTVPYSSPQLPFLGQIKDVALDNVQNADILQYDDTTRNWKNVVGGGGGGATITGIDDAAVFKSGTNQGEGDNAGITRIPASLGYTMNLDTANKFVGINQINPSVQLDIAGGMHITDGSNKIEIDGENIGIISGTDVLTLFSHNTNLSGSNLRVNSLEKKAECSAWRSNDPRSFDTPNTTDTDSIYKIKLQRGMDKEAGGGLFDAQENYNPTLGFPSGQITEYQNQMNINKPVALARVATGIAVAPASVYVISSMGTQTAFQDQMLYDPMQMRSRLTFTAWVFCGAPTIYRVADLKVGWTIKWYFNGRWLAPSANNRMHMYVNQFRNGILLRTYLVQVSNNDQTCMMSGERTFLTWSNGFNEDFDVLTDDWQVEIANQGTSDLRVDLGQCEFYCWKAQ